jgi:hypothetical protein
MNKAEAQIELAKIEVEKLRKRQHMLQLLNKHISTTTDDLLKTDLLQIKEYIGEL